MPKASRTRQRNTDFPVTLNVDIQPGPASPAQKQAWERFWQKLVSQAKDELKREDEKHT